MNGDAVRDVADTSSFSGAPSAFCLAIAQIAVQAVFTALRAVDKAIDGLMRDDPVTVFALKLARDDLRRPSHRKAVADALTELA